MCDCEYVDPYKEIAAEVANDIFVDGYDPQLAIADVLQQLVKQISDFAEKEKTDRCRDIDASLDELKQIALMGND